MCVVSNQTFTKCNVRLHVTARSDSQAGNVQRLDGLNVKNEDEVDRNMAGGSSSPPDTDDDDVGPTSMLSTGEGKVPAPDLAEIAPLASPMKGLVAFYQLQ